MFICIESCLYHFESNRNVAVCCFGGDVVLGVSHAFYTQIVALFGTKY